MGLFSKKEPETGPNGYKKHFTNVIKNSGTSQMLIWRQPEEDFNTNSTLIVASPSSANLIKFSPFTGIVFETFVPSGNNDVDKISIISSSNNDTPSCEKILLCLRTTFPPI